MRFTSTPVEGVTIIEVDRIVDDRGFFGRVWCRDEFTEQGLDADWVQANVGARGRARYGACTTSASPTPR
jgi:dTDP-4-dehydrorhamnose 3,5-epimerase